MKTALLSVLSAALVLGVSSASADDIPPVVDSAEVAGTTMPWSTTLNPAHAYGKNDGTGPVVFTAADGFDFTSGSEFVIFATGETSPYSGTPPYAGPLGDATFIANSSPGNSGNYFPSLYVDTSTYPAYLNALIGTFTDANGVVVGTPFLVGANITVAAPVGAAQLQFGLNDDIFSDNTGNLEVTVGESATPQPSVPDHGNTALLLGFGLLGMMAIGQRRSSMALACVRRG